MIQYKWSFCVFTRVDWKLSIIDCLILFGGGLDKNRKIIWKLWKWFFWWSEALQLVVQKWKHRKQEAEEDWRKFQKLYYSHLQAHEEPSNDISNKDCAQSWSKKLKHSNIQINRNELEYLTAVEFKRVQFN